MASIQRSSDGTDYGKCTSDRLLISCISLHYCVNRILIFLTALPQRARTKSKKSSFCPLQPLIISQLERAHWYQVLYISRTPLGMHSRLVVWPSPLQTQYPLSHSKKCLIVTSGVDGYCGRATGFYGVLQDRHKTVPSNT
ncbi:hypothetical protein Zmor_000261 [Zophobas morio]|uniref:Uncharacterized protein n=1 Tax=Zophobas morio TaxID=2755281 RepID=A0AA38IZP1_9CUCU|nr:hypothetical protein Zmor_000261 [Zophobas morio]